MKTTTPSATTLALARGWFARLHDFLRHFALKFFRLVPDHKREDLVAEVLAIGWRCTLDLARRRKCPIRFRGHFARQLCFKVRSGRRLAGKVRCRDLLAGHDNPRGIAGRPGLMAPDHPLPDRRADGAAARTDLRLDLSELLATCPDRARRALQAVADGTRFKDAAERHGLEEHQLYFRRQQLRARWVALQALHGPGD